MQLKVDVSDSCDIPVTCRQALFVFYNCARLSKILEKYKNEVGKGRHGMLSSLVLTKMFCSGLSNSLSCYFRNLPNIT